MADRRDGAGRHFRRRPATRRHGQSKLRPERCGVKFQCHINGQAIDADIAPRMLLSDFIRHELRLTGTNIGCEMGVCRCVHRDRRWRADPFVSDVCRSTDGCHVETVESLASNGKLNPLQQAFHEHHALQCGYCTPGFLMTVEALSRQERASVQQGRGAASDLW